MRKRLNNKVSFPDTSFESYANMDDISIESYAMDNSDPNASYADMDLSAKPKSGIFGETVSNIADSFVGDLALAGATYAGTAAALAPTGLGVMATGAIAAPFYMAAKYALTGKSPEPNLTTMIPGSENINPTLLGTVEEMALWSMVPKVFEKGGKVGSWVAGKVGLKRLLPGVNKYVTKQIEPITKSLSPAAEKVWDVIKIPTVGGGVLGAGVGALGNKEDRVKGALIGGAIGAGLTGASELVTRSTLKKTFTETFQPALERMEKKLPKVAAMFRESNVEKSLVAKTAREFGDSIAAENPSTLYEIGKALRSGKMAVGTKDKTAKAILTNFDTKITKLKLNDRYESAFRTQLSKLNLLPSEEASAVSKYMVKKLSAPENASLKEIHNVLREVIKNPKNSPQAVAMAKDLWNLPVVAPRMIAEASRTAAKEVLMRDLMTTKGVFSSTLKEGYMSSKTIAFKNAIIHRDVELELQAMDKLPKIAEGIFNKFFMSPWKTSKTIMRPATHMRNMFSNTILNDWGGLPFYRIDVYNTALNHMKSNHQEYKKFLRLIGEDAKFSSGDVTQLSGSTNWKNISTLSRSNKEDANIFEKGLNVFDRVVAPARSLYNAEETMFKYAKYLHNIEKKMSSKEAAFDAVKWTFNFSEVTPELAQIGSTAMPFVRWFSKVIPMGLETAVKHPARFGKWFAFYQALQASALDNVNITEHEWDRIQTSLPEYMQKGLYLLMPFRDQKNQLNMLDLTYTMPFIGDISELYGKSPASAILQNPIYTAASAYISKKKFSGVPLYYDWEAPTTKFAKSMAYAWEQLGPSILPGGTDWRKLYDAFTEGDNAMSPEVAIANTFGFKLTPVNEIANLRRKKKTIEMYEKEIKSSLRRELKESKEEGETSKIIDKYKSYMEDTRK